jgi:uncharacterized protein YndB with AHSA1/START domain
VKALIPLAALLALPACGPAAFAAERQIQKEVTVKAPVAEVWKAWSTSEGVQSFFAPEAVVEARPEGAFDVRFNPYAPPGMRGADGMRVLGVQEQRMISFTWNAPPHLPEARAQRTFVVVRMNPLSSAQTRVSLTHTGWGDGGQWDQARDYFDKAWDTVLGNLRKRFVEGPVDWKPWLARMRAFQDEEDRKARPRADPSYNSAN